VLANIRACMFGAWTFMLAIPLFIVMMSMALPVLALDKFRCAAAAAAAAAATAAATAATAAAAVEQQQ
jgi:1-acyl-sn-glycerol-3-phosphate acyltransferase